MLKKETMKSLVEKVEIECGIGFFVWLFTLLIVVI